MVILKLRNAVIFHIEEDDVNTDCRSLCLQLAGYFEQYAYTTGTVVRSENRFAVVALIGVIISPRTTVPMGTKHHAAGRLGIVGTNDVARLQYLTVISGQVGTLVVYLGSKSLKSGCKIIAT